MRKIWILAALLALAMPALSYAGALPSRTQTAEETDAVYPDDLYLGKADAKLTIIEYASLSCPHCAKFNKDVLPKIKEAYIDTGLVRWIYRDYPLNRPAFQASILAHCASPIRFFSLVDTLFQSQDYWLGQAQPLIALKQIGTSLGIDEKSYDACLTDEALKKKILERQQDADTRYKVDSTPTFIIRGKPYPGEMSYENFKKLIDEALGQS